MQFTWIMVVAGLMAAISPASAQQWPARPVTMVVPFAAGGAGDVLGRVLAARLAELLAQPVIVENVGAGGGMAGVARVAKAAPDGYQFVYGNIGTHAQSQALYKRPLYNAVNDFTPVALITETSSVLTVRNDLPVADLPTFVAYAKANQARMQFGSGGAASPAHLACLMLNAMMGVNIIHIPYRGSGQAMQDMISGHIDYQCTTTATALSAIQSRQVRALAILSRLRSPFLPDLPSAHEQGLHDLEAGSWTAFFMPKATPPAIVGRLHDATVAAMETPLVQRRLGELGAIVVAPERRSPEYLRQFVESEIARWSATIKAAGVSVE